LDKNGNIVVEYGYDAWGKPMYTSGSMAATFGADNPFRYRAYYYDSETGLYYLNSRYYNPEWGRFINVDGQINDGLLGTNLFAYCKNNPVNREDPKGHDGGVISGTVLLIFVASVIFYPVLQKIVKDACDAIAQSISIPRAIPKKEATEKDIAPPLSPDTVIKSVTINMGW